MEYRLLGDSGLAVSRLCLGTMTFGAETDRAGSFAQLDAFVEAGGTFIDTADVYSRGVSEQLVGDWLGERADARDQVVLATKGRFPMNDGPNGVGLSRRHLHDALEASLRRLGVESIDLYQLHAWDPLTPIDEYLRFIDDAIGAGKVHYFGLSNFVGWQLTAVAERAAAQGWTVPVSLQPQYNLLTRYIELEIVPACERYGLGLMPWSPLAGGWLTGKYRRDTRPSGASRLGDNPARGMEAYDRRNTDATWAVLDALEDVAKQSGLTMAQAALAWLADRPQVTSPIVGARTLEQLQGSLAVAEVHLDGDAARRLTEVSEPALPDYPYGELGIDQRSRTLP
ncbi:MAG: aldo/keto reductase [Micropruina glycogenica]|uniref:Predicted oxidoreductase n=1 Tax=Micropruina glycogenica TaxID=75385 RepID=A0A2N9JM12_9ACTN|nr:aldo/keto reductase [Micropruina glycogenica]MCB0891931.1 aldo/keto reductase [Propionibacteriaceae bacterium]SPD88621.1 Predicted oxidoreductase [Micropruina glycogenica]